MAEIAAGAAGVGASLVSHGLEEIKSILGKRITSLDEVHKALNDGLKSLLALQMDKDNEVWRNRIQKNLTNFYVLWTERVSNIEKQVASLNGEYDEEKKKKSRSGSYQVVLKADIKSALSQVIKLLEECETVTKRVIKEVGVPSMEEYPTLQKAFQEVLSLLQSEGVKCVALEGQKGTGKTTLMQHLNNHFYDNSFNEEFKFDVVIFIKGMTTDKHIDDEELSILQKIAYRIGVDIGGNKLEVGEKVLRVLGHLRYLLILHDIHYPSTLEAIARSLCLNISRGDGKVIITTQNPLSMCSVVEKTTIKLQPLSSNEARKMFLHFVGPQITKPASPLGGESSSKSTGSIDIGKRFYYRKQNLARETIIRLMRIRDLIDAILSYPMRIGYEDFLKRWIDDVYQIRFAYDDADSLRRRVEHLLSERPPRYVQALISEDITTEIINGGTKTPPKQVPQPILHLATRLALHQLTLTLTSHLRLEFDDSFGRLEFDIIKNIWFSTRDDEEKRNVVDNIQANSQIREAFDLKIVNLNHFIDEIEREKGLLEPETRLEQTASAESSTKNNGSRRLVVVVDKDGDIRADPFSFNLAINDSENVVVFITTQSSIDYLTNNVDMAIRTEDHLLPWELFCEAVGSELLHSSNAIQRIAGQIVEKCGGHLLATILMAKSLKHVTDVQIWESAWQKLCDHGREPIVNAFIFNIIWGIVTPERDKVRLIRCLLMVCEFQWKMRDDQLFDCWFSELLVDTKEEAKSILQKFMARSVLLQLDTQGRDIILPNDIKNILQALREEGILENLSEGALESTISDLQVLNLSNTHMQHLYDVSTSSYSRHLNLDGCTLETLPKAIFKLKKLESLSLKHCTQLLELPPQIAELENLKELILAWCDQLKTLPEDIWELLELETLSLEHCSQLLELPPHFAELDNLKELRLVGCTRLETFPQEIWELPKLHILSLPGTSISPASENQDLINSNYKPRPSSSGYDEQSGRGKGIPSSSSNITPSDFILRLKVHGGSKQLEELCKIIMQLQIQDLENCDLSGAPLIGLPQSLNFPQLKSLMLQNNLNLMKIPPSFFDLVPLLNILDLSRTSIHELPASVFKLKELRELHLKECELFAELPPKIGQLINLTTLNLDGTLITHLPEEVHELKKLKSLSLSFYNDSDHDSRDVIADGVLTQLNCLEVLRISVNPDNEWWFKNFERVLLQISALKALRVLDVYIPGDKFKAPIEDSLNSFRFIIGRHKPRMISRVPPALELMFRKHNRSLKFVNGEDFPDKVMSILSKSNAFFLDRHMKINNLDQFGLRNLKHLRLYILAECNEMQSIIDVDEYGADSSTWKESFCMQFLTIFYMKNLRSILNKPIRDNNIFCKLKLLALHTCPQLTTIFTIDSINSLVNLEELIVEDCPNVSSVISCSSSEPKTSSFLPRLRKLSLLFVPELSSITNGVHIGRNLEQIGLYYCPKLQCLSSAELSSEELKVIRGEKEWWGKLQWSEAEWGQEDPRNKFNQIFSEFDEDLDILTQMTPYELNLSIDNKESDSE